jgi:4-hydroxybenzoate polyprenyltransferase/phosphoserine phosphatase
MTEHGEERPLVVDLDGTLLRGDLLLETASAYVTAHPLECWRPLAWLLRGKVHLKGRLADCVDCRLATLPYNSDVLAWLTSERQAGRRLVLATASHRRLADEVATHLGIFDEVLATEGETNLKATAKRDALVARYGKGGFDYVGNDSADLAVWAAAKRAWLVEPSWGLEARARRVVQVIGVFDSGLAGRLRAWAKALRLHQWVKNLLVFVPLFTAHLLGSPEDVKAAFLAFILFSICASSAYVLNDVIDVRDDREHPRKRMRPFASGELSLLAGWTCAPILAICAFAAAYLLLPIRFLAALAGYYLLTLAYSFFLKKIAMLDVVTLACLYTLRLIAGAATIAVPMSFWLLAFSMFIFASLALIKRYTELRVVSERKAEEKAWGRGYYADDRETLASLGASAGYLSVMVLALYIQDPATIMLYSHPRVIWLACPLLAYWIGRIWLIARRGQMHDDPVVFAIKDRVSWLVGALLVGVFAAAR